MSWFEPTDVACPRCSHAYKCGTAETINVTRMPWAKEQILAGTFHQSECPECGLSFWVDRDFLYTDFEQARFVHVFPSVAQEEWPALETVTEEVFENTCAEGPPFVREFSARFAVRTVFGLRQLGEKVRLWDAGLDDAAAELLKLELLLASPELRQRPTLEMLVTEVDLGADRLVIEAFDREGNADVISFAAQLRRYRELDADRARLIERFPGLYYRPFRSFRRLTREMVVD